MVELSSEPNTPICFKVYAWAIQIGVLLGSADCNLSTTITMVYLL